MLDQSEVYLFVYGTLKRGHNRHQLLVNEEFVGEAMTEPDYRLVQFDDYPGLIVSDDMTLAYAVQGELYRVAPQTMRQIDIVEGVDEGLFARRPVKLVDTQVCAHTYFFQMPSGGLPDCGPKW